MAVDTGSEKGYLKVRVQTGQNGHLLLIDNTRFLEAVNVDRNCGVVGKKR